VNLFSFFPVCVQIQTVDGEASLDIKVPGTFGACTDPNKEPENVFNGYQDPFPTGRYLDYCEIWADEFDAGDRVTNFCVKDKDGVIPEGLRANFPEYPVIGKFFDDGLEETENIKPGLFVQPTKTLRIGNIDKIPMFVPSGLYICGTFKSGGSTEKTVRCNFFWGKKL